MNKYLISLLLFVISFNAQILPKFGDAKGLFLSFGGGPRVPLGEFAEDQNIGVGLNISLSYTDNNYIPVFIYLSAEYQHFPGSQDFYKTSDYSSFSSNVLSISPGIRYYLPPLIDDMFLLMPVVEGGFTFSLFEKYHQFKLDRNKKNFLEEVAKSGFHAGLGISMFLMDVIAHYNYLHNNQYLSIDIKVRIPIYVII